jgi:hypothetical protein
MNAQYKVWHRSFEKEEELKYLQTTLTNQNPMQKENKSGLKSVNVCYHSVQNPLSSRHQLPVWDYVTHIEEGTWVRVFGNMVLWRIFGPEGDGVGRECRKLNIQELSDLLLLPNILGVIKAQRMRWAWHVECMGGRRNVYKFLMLKPQGKTSLGRPRRRWGHNIKIVLREVGRGA